jgi:hypothetical protein
VTGDLQGLVLAHAFGQRYALPVPLLLFVIGGALVVFVSFLVVLPRAVPAGLDAGGDVTGRVSPGPTLQGTSGLVLLLLVATGLGGSTEVGENLLPTAFWLVGWVAVPISCGLVGDWTRFVNPFAALARASDRDRTRKALINRSALAWPSRLGWWPAAAAFFIVACGELVLNATATQPRVTAVGLMLYAQVTIVGSVVFGADAWIERGELFSVLFSTWGRLGWFRFGAPGRRGFLRGVDATSFEASVSRVTFNLLLLVSVSFDGLLATPFWRDARLRLSAGVAPGTAAYQAGEVLVFILLVVAAWILFGAFARAVQRLGRLDGNLSQAVASMLPSLLPIAFGYLVAHNAEYVAINGQMLFPLVGNPLGMSWWPTFPYPFNDSYEVAVNAIPTSVVWYLQVLLIVAVHVAAVVLAHRYLARRAAPGRARIAEWPWIVVMLAYTMSSLWLLAQPLVEGG